MRLAGRDGLRPYCFKGTATLPGPEYEEDSIIWTTFHAGPMEVQAISSYAPQGLSRLITKPKQPLGHQGPEMIKICILGVLIGGIDRRRRFLKINAPGCALLLGLLGSPRERSKDDDDRSYITTTRRMVRTDMQGLYCIFQPLGLLCNRFPHLCFWLSEDFQ